MTNVAFLIGLGMAIGAMAMVLKHMGREDISAMLTLAGFVVAVGLVWRQIYGLFKTIETMFNINGIL